MSTPLWQTEEAGACDFQGIPNDFKRYLSSYDRREESSCVESWSFKKQDCTAMMSSAESVNYVFPRLHVVLKLFEHVEKGTVEIYFVGTEYQLADLFTKALPKDRTLSNFLFIDVVIIMAQQQHAADVHPDELCPPNKRYYLMDTNKKVDLEHVQCPPESKILTNIIKNHPLRFSIAASSSVAWIYMTQFWHTLKEDKSKYRLSSIPRNDESNIPGTRIEPQSDKESSEVEIAKEKEVEITQETKVEITQKTPAVDITNVIIPVNVTDEDEEITDEVYELKRREKGKNVERGT
ncbi:hypothetical protein Tco_1042141 [Tanacetum coccineum]|uniref:Uncharacterized protein n=1 Tax=Tanacetum coccineum TaxID=301880 RepID=A0ABQ5GJN3_9ASTR